MSSSNSVFQIYQNGYINAFREKKETLFFEESKGASPSHLVFLISLSSHIFDPPECAMVLKKIVDRYGFDVVIYRRALAIYKEIAHQLDVRSLVKQFESDDVLSRGLLVSICPVPLDPEYAKFIFETANSPYVYNRIAFLHYLESLIGTEIPTDYQRAVKGVLESFSNDKSPYVKVAWLKPALHFLKENPHLKAFLKRLCDQSEAIEVRVALALNFKQVYELVPSVTKLLQSKDNTVLAALIPNIADVDIKMVDLDSLYRNEDPTIRVCIMRYLGRLKPEYIDLYIAAESNEVNNELVRYLGRLNNATAAKYIQKVITKVRANEKTDQYNWRTMYELMSIPEELQISVGDSLFEAAADCIFRHPMALMKAAAKVLRNFRNSDAYTSNKEAVIEGIAKRLEANNTEYCSIALRELLM